MTLVVDASAVAEILLGTQAGRRAAAVLDGHELIAPQHLTAEVASVIRGWSLSRQITDDIALRAFREFEALDIEQVPMMYLLPAVYALRHNISAYDAMYVVLARAAGCSLLTLDARLAASVPDCAQLPKPLSAVREKPSGESTCPVLMRARKPIDGLGGQFHFAFTAVSLCFDDL